MPEIQFVQINMLSGLHTQVNVPLWNVGPLVSRASTAIRDFIERVLGGADPLMSRRLQKPVPCSCFRLHYRTTDAYPSRRRELKKYCRILC